MWIFIGLGNPGDGYAKHRHNVGFMVIKALQQTWFFPPMRNKGTYLWTEGQAEGQKIALCQPITYMNRSGEALSNFIPNNRQSNWVVIHDELDLPCGEVRFKQGGGTGGHNGLKSLHRFLGPDYRRLRFGIDRPTHKEDVADYVLSSFSVQQRLKIESATEHLLMNIDVLLAGDEEKFMTRLHTKPC
jgi:peptidyl-tRNA hydrolase, PTH1 family